MEDCEALNKSLTVGTVTRREEETTKREVKIIAGGGRGDGGGITLCFGHLVCVRVRRREHRHRVSLDKLEEPVSEDNRLES